MVRAAEGGQLRIPDLHAAGLAEEDGRLDLDVAAPPGGPWHVPCDRYFTAEAVQCSLIDHTLAVRTLGLVHVLVQVTHHFRDRHQIAGTFDLLVEDAELARRRAAGANGNARPRRGYRKLFLDHVLQADEGCDFDFLRKA